MKKITAALVVAGTLLASQAQAARLTDNSLTLGVSSRDGDTGFMVGGEGRPKATTGLAFAGDYLREDFGPLTRSRLRVAPGIGHFFEAGNIPQYAAVRAGLWYDDLTGTSNEASWYAQAHYELTPVEHVNAGLILTHTDAWNKGNTLEAYGRYHFNKHFAGELSYTADFDDVEGDDRIMLSLRISHDWL